jgi:hypothetical protein
VALFRALKAVALKVNSSPFKVNLLASSPSIISKTVSNIKNLTWGKNDQHIKIYLPCNFEVNLIIHLGVIALFF